MTPMNVARVVAPDGEGAGASKESPVSMFAGLKVPVVKEELSGRALAAASSRVRLTFVMLPLPPTSDMRTRFCPPGPTSRMSISSEKECDKFSSRTLRSMRLGGTPPRKMFDG